MEQIQNVNVLTQSNKDSLEYAVYVIRNRAIPDEKDGLKPVLRRILYCAVNDFKEQEFSKTIAVASRVIQKYNPHGDAAVVSTIANMIRPMCIKLPTMLGDGAWGNKSNSRPASPRYTGTKISPFSIDNYMDDLKKDKRSCDWKQNYDNTCLEPIYLPSKLPMLLINGQMGIAVGLKTSIPSHNVNEVIDATIKLIKNKNADFLLIPDECMNCDIINTDWKTINETGHGTYIVQAHIEIVDYNDKKALRITNLPDFTYFTSIRETLDKLVENNKIPFLQDIVVRDRVTKNGDEIMDQYIILRKGTDPNFAKEFLYNNTSLRQTRQVKLIVIKNNNFSLVNYRQYLLDFIEFRKRTIFRLYNSKLQKTKTSIHESALYIKVLTSGKIDSIIDMIRKQKTNNDEVLIDTISKKLDVSYLQAKFLLGTNLKKLSLGYLHQYQEDLKENLKKEKIYMNMIIDERNIEDYIIKELLELKKKYGSPRLCSVLSESEISGIAPGMFKLIFTSHNFVKKLGEDEVLGSVTKDSVNFVVIADNTKNVIVLSEIGRSFKIPVNKIPISSRNSNGTDIRLIDKNIISNICSVITENDMEALIKNKKRIKPYIFIITEKSFIKKIDLEDISTSTASGLIYSKLEFGDKVKEVIIGPDSMDLLIYMGNKVLRISSNEVPYLKRFTKGNRATSSKEIISGMTFVTPVSTEMIVVSNKGYVNRIPITSIPLSSRGKAGSKVIKLNKDDFIKSICTCKKENTLVIFEYGKTTRIPVNEIPIGTTLSSGVKLCSSPNRIGFN